MTKEENKKKKRKKEKRALPAPRQIIFSFMSLFSLALVIRNSELAVKYAAEGLSLCAKTVIPSLFPFMVLSDIIVTSGAAAIPAKLLQKPMRFLFGVSGAGGCAVILGMLCGFPVGARSALTIYDSGTISKQELEHLLTFCNSPSSAFLISAVGASLFGSRNYGVALYIIVLLSAIVTGILQNIIFRKKQNKSTTISPHSSTIKNNIDLSVEKFTTSDFTEAVSSSALSLIKISAFVVFFTVFLGTLTSTLDSLQLSPKSNAILFGFFEMTSGMVRSAAISPARHGAILAAFCAGWSGLSVHFQIMSICANRSISFKPYFKAKIFQGILSAVLMKLYLDIFGKHIIFNAEPTALFAPTQAITQSDIAVWLCFLTALICGISKFRKNRKNKEFFTT